MLEAARAVSNRNIPSGPRHTPLPDPAARALESPPALDAPSGLDGTHRSNPRNLLRRSAPVSTGSPSESPGLALWEYPRVATCRCPSRYTRASLAAVCRSWRATIPESHPEILPHPLPTAQSLRSIGHPPQGLHRWLAPFSIPLPAYPADRSGHIKRRTGISAPASPSDVVSVSAKRVSPAADQRFPRPPTPSSP